MKKILSLITILLLSILLTSCKPEEKEYTRYFDSMGTIISVQVTYHDENILDKIEDIFDLYSQISSSYNRHEVYRSSPYYDYENIYSINLEAGRNPVQVVDELIELVEYGLMLNVTTKGYFNIGIRNLVSFWKKAIPTRDFGDEEFEPMSEESYDTLVKNAQEIPNIDLTKVIIDKDNKTIFLEDENIQLDLGALSKGYALNKAVELLKENKIKKYVLNAGSSSIAFGYKDNDENYNISLKDHHNKYVGSYLGILRTKNTALTTSGSSEQHLAVVKDDKLIKEKLIHHIVSPFSKKPENYYYSIFLVADNAGLMDAFSTAVFLMDVNTAVEFLEANNVSYVLYLLDYSVVTNMDEDIFKLQPLKEK